MGAIKGWEVISPRFSTMGFWLALVYDGARVVGVDDMRGLAREARVPYFPDDYPDTEAGRAWEGRGWSLAFRVYSAPIHWTSHFLEHAFFASHSLCARIDGLFCMLRSGRQ
jgi:hypothetical protein